MLFVQLSCFINCKIFVCGSNGNRSLIYVQKSIQNFRSLLLSVVASGLTTTVQQMEASDSNEIKENIGWNNVLTHKISGLIE